MHPISSAAIFILITLWNPVTAVALRNRTASDTVQNRARGDLLLFSANVYDSSDCSGDWTAVDWYGESEYDTACANVPGGSIELFWPGCLHFNGIATTHSEGGCGGSSSSILSPGEGCHSNLPYNAIQWKCDLPGPN